MTAEGPASGISVFAPAKVNLTLHVTGRRDDGYHELDSLVAFGAVGDDVTLVPAKETSLIVDGPEAGGVPSGGDNLVLRAASALPSAPAVAIRLTKRLPVSSGIGGGSADAAAVLRGLAELGTGEQAEDRDAAAHAAAALALGADVPMCLRSSDTRARGVGDRLTDVAALPPLPALLVNPRVPVSTPDVFRGLASRSNPPMPDELPVWESVVDASAWLATQRNDLEVPAQSVAPVIAEVTGRLSAIPGCLFARMSGSGATCFALFATEAETREAAERIAAEQPDWWVSPTVLGCQAERAAPRVLARTWA